MKIGYHLVQTIGNNILWETSMGCVNGLTEQKIPRMKAGTANINELGY